MSEKQYDKIAEKKVLIFYFINETLRKVTVRDVPKAIERISKEKWFIEGDVIINTDKVTHVEMTYEDVFDKYKDKYNIED